MEFWRFSFFVILILYTSSSWAHVLNAAIGGIKAIDSVNGLQQIRNNTEAVFLDVAKGSQNSYQSVRGANEMLQSGYQYASPVIFNQHSSVTASPLHHRLGQRNTNFVSSSSNSNLNALPSSFQSSPPSPSSFLQQPENEYRVSASDTISTPFNKMAQNGHRLNLSKAQALAILLLNSFYGNSNRLLEKTNSNPVLQPTVSRFPQQSSRLTDPVSNRNEASNQSSMNAVKPQQSAVNYQISPELSSLNLNSLHAECQTANKQDDFGAVLNRVNYDVAESEAKQYQSQLGQFGSQLGQVGGQLNQFGTHSMLTKDRSVQLEGQSTTVGEQLRGQSGQIEGQSGQIGGQSAQIAGQLNQQFGGYLGQFDGQSAQSVGQPAQIGDNFGQFYAQSAQIGGQLGRVGGQSSQQSGGYFRQIDDPLAGQFAGQLGQFEEQAKRFRGPPTQYDHHRGQLSGQSAQSMVHLGAFNTALWHPNAAVATTNNATTSSSSTTASASMSPSSSSSSISAPLVAQDSPPNLSVPQYAADQKGLNHYKLVQSRPEAWNLFNSKQQQKQQKLYYSTPSAAALDYLRMHLKSLDFEPANYQSASPTDAQQEYKQRPLAPSPSPSPSSPSPPPPPTSQSQLQSSDSAVFQPSAEIYHASVHRPHALYGVPPMSGGSDATPSPTHPSFLPSNGEFQSSYF